MDEALQQLIDARIAAAVDAVSKSFTAQIAEAKAAAGQIAEANVKIGEMQKNLKIVTDTVAGQKLITPEDVKRLLGEEAMARDAKTSETQKAAEAAAALKTQREAFTAEKLKGVPAVYHGQLGDDPAKWADAEKAIRTQFQTDLTAAGIKASPLGGSPGGASPSGSAGGAARQIGGLSEGLSAYAAGLKMPA